MSWWETGPRRVLIGDLPADRFNDALKQVASARAASKTALPDLPELLAAMLAVLQRRDPDLRGIRAMTGSGEISAAAAADPMLAEALQHAVDAVARSYVEAMDRAPTTGEVLANLQFVLGPEPQEYLSDGKNLQLRDIVADSGKDR